MLPDKDRTKEQLVSELVVLRQQVAKLESVENECKRAEEALLDSDEYQRLFELSPVGITILDVRGVITACNSAVYMKSGYSKDDFIGQHFSKVATIRARDIPKFIKIFASLIRGKVPKPLEVMYTRKDGTTGWTEAHISLMKLSGKRIGIQVIQNDITERKQAEEVLRESEARFRTSIENMLDCFGIYSAIRDDSGRIVDFQVEYVNEAACVNNLMTKEEQIGKRLCELLPSHRETGLFDEYCRVVETGKSLTKQSFFYEDVYRKRRLVRVFDIRVTKLGDGFAAAWRDITEHKRAEESLRHSEERFRTLFETMSEGVVLIDGDGQIILANPATERITGLKRPEIEDHSYEDPGWPLLRPDGTRMPPAEMAGPRTMKEKQPIRDMLMGLNRPDGSISWINVNTTPLINEVGEINYIVLTFADITQRKQAEAELEFSRKELEGIMRNVIDGIGVSDVQGKIIQANRALAEMHGYDSPDEVIGCPFFDFVAKEDLPRIAERFQEMMVKKEKTIKNIEMIGLKKDGSKFPEMINIANTWDKDGSFTRSFVVARDITERKQAEEREKELQQELILSRRLAAVGELAASVGHEINNPLTGILGFSERLLRKSTDEEIRLDLERIHDEAQRMVKVMDNLRTFTRRREPEKQYSDINGILQMVLELRAYELRTGNIEVVTDLASGLPEVEVDSHQIQEVFLNIILNAEQAMTEAQGGGKLTIKTEKIKDYVRTSFTDDGPGISAEHLDKLFDPFFTTRGEEGGTGLRLSVCHSIVAKHGGRLYARSKAGEGATFFVELPVATEGIDEGK